jgi:hypothetical protein
LRVRELKGYYKKMIKEIKNPNANIQQLFSEHDELFLLLKSVFPNLPSKITIQTKKVIYPDLSPQKMYPDIGVESMYFIWSGTLLDEIEIKYGKGEKPQDKNGKYPNLKEGQWYDYDRMDNPTKEGSTFWKASLYNTIKGQHHFYHTIEQRHAYYKFVDAYLKTKGIISEWFDAAARVTMGAMSDKMQGETALGAAEGVNLYYLSDSTEEFLKMGNRYLFSDNMQNVKLLLAGEGKLSGEFMDAKGNKQSFRDLSKQELDFKLVEFEQSLVQEYINSSFSDLNNSFMKKSLDEVPSTSGNEKYDTIVKQVSENFTHWMAPDIIQDIMEKHFMKEGKLTFNFANYDDRVKLGQLMVKELYYLREKDTFSAKTDKIILAPKSYALKPTQKPFNPSKKVADKEIRIKEIYAKIRLSGKRIIKIYKNINALKEGFKNNEYPELARILEMVKLELEAAFQDYINNIKRLKYAIDKYIKKIKKYWENPEELKEEIEKIMLLLYNEFNKEIKNQVDEFYEEIKGLSENMYTEFKWFSEDLYKSLEEMPKHLENLEESIGNVKETVLNSYDKLKEYWEDPNELLNDVEDYTDKKMEPHNPALIEYLTKTAVAIYPDLMEVVRKDGKKGDLLRTNYQATVAILLYEFANGTNVPERKFNYNEHVFANKILEGRVLKEIMKEAVDILERDHYDFKNMPNSAVYLLTLDFSPSLSPRSWLEALDKHFDSNLAQFFLGGSVAYFYIENKKMVGQIQNKTSRSSVMLHLAKDYEGKNKNLASITQKIYFTFDLNKK